VKLGQTGEGVSVMEVFQMYDVRARRCAGIMFGAILGVLTGFTSGCETNPYTGRSQLLMTSVSQEMQLGAQAYNQVKNDPKMKPSQDPKEIEPVKRVAARIVEAAKRSKYAEIAQQFQWEVTVIKDDKTANAFALPGGKMAVYTGIFPMAKTEAGLAAVMGHEVVHALARHGAERMSQGQLTTAALQVAGAAAGASGMNPLLSQAPWRHWEREHKSVCCFPSVANTNRKQIISAYCLRPTPATIHGNRWLFGNGCPRCLVVARQPSSCPRIQVMKRGSTS
jgi:hypothetical protein